VLARITFLNLLMRTYSFEKLEGWQNARQLTLWIYQVTSTFPKNELFGLVSQMRRASVSIASNLAEGTSRTTKRDQARFSVIAYSSTVELLNQLILCFDLKLILENEYNKGREIIERQTFLITKLRNSQSN
jgi:four helix bundle protein